MILKLLQDFIIIIFFSKQSFANDVIWLTALRK